MINIIGIDPGGTTGIAHLVSDCPPKFHELTPRNAEQWIWAYLSVWTQPSVARPPSILHIVCERFITSKRSVRVSRQSDAADVGGAIQTLCTDAQNVRFHWQTPSDAKLITDYVLRRTNLKPKIRMPHAADVARHAALALLKYYPQSYKHLRLS